MTSGAVGRRLRQAVGALVLALSLLPVHRLLTPERAGPAGVATAAASDAALDLLWAGTTLVLGLAVALSVLVSPETLQGALRRGRRVLTVPPPPLFAGGLFALTLVLGVAVSLGIHQGLPRLLDEMAQLLHARYFAAGMLAGPLPEPTAARLIQNSLVTPAGWASIYPPGHTALLALGMGAGVPWLVGPLLLGVVPPLVFLSLVRLFPHRPGTCRLAALMVALSPFLLFLGSGYLSHVTALAAATVAFHAALRAWQGRGAWALASGAALGLMVTSRPWVGLVLGGYLTAGVWTLSWWRDGRPVGWLARRLAAAVAGGLPFAAALFAYDHRLFGAWSRLGYGAAFGPSHGLGLHVDPWGNFYGLGEAVGYTGADLSTLGLHLLETPFSLVALGGLLLLLVPRLSHGTRLLAGWALAPVLANALYWHHGQHLGPRMLLEAAPAWIVLAVLAVAALAEGGRDPGTTGRDAELRRGRTPVSRAVLWSAVAAVLGSGALLPARIGSYRWPPAQLPWVTLPPADPDGPLLVFVHGTWANRVASTLVSLGMRRDSVETALRRNDLCRVHEYAEARAAGLAELPELDLVPLPGTPAHLQPRLLSPGERVRLDPAREVSPSCLQHAVSDRLGVVELAPLLWQTALPGEEGGALLVRDLGPDLNERTLAAYPGRTPLVLSPVEPGGPPRILEYSGGMGLLWGVSAPAGALGPGMDEPR